MLTYALSQRGEQSLYEYLYCCIREDIEQGRIAADEKLPSKRALARHLGVSLITVEGAYAQLIAEGYVRSVPRRGYYACDLGKEKPHALDTVSSAPISALRGMPSSQGVIDLAGGTIPVGLFPYGTWAKSVREALSCESEQLLLGEGSAAGLRRLRETIACYLRGFRGMEVNPDCIVIGAGSQVLYNVLVQLLGHDKAYGIEDPGYPRLTSIYQANNISLVHIPLDSLGISMSALHDASVDVVHLMPSHQFPTGLVTSISRRYELLGWAASAENRYLIEDDYDCEFRLTGKPIPSLQSIDASGRVIYANTFTKSLGPAFRIGYMVLPEALAQRFHERLGFYSSTVSAIDQLALARFIEDGHYERHVNRMRTFYRSTRNQLIAALRTSEVLKRCRIEAQDSGIHFVLDASDYAPHGEENMHAWSRRVCREAEQCGVRLCAIASYYRGISVPAKEYSRFLISYGGLSQEAIPSVVCALEQVFSSTLLSGGKKPV